MTFAACLEHRPMHIFGKGYMCARCHQPIVTDLESAVSAGANPIKASFELRTVTRAVEALRKAAYIFDQNDFGHDLRHELREVADALLTVRPVQHRVVERPPLAYRDDD
ncbi:MAG: hypothetical protein E5W35_34115 [Mesorhizobium sp.]|nr:MAG: hypothetical protein E5W35_34115 [Mesorhizobium sp.]